MPSRLRCCCDGRLGSSGPRHVEAVPPDRRVVGTRFEASRRPIDPSDIRHYSERSVSDNDGPGLDVAGTPATPMTPLAAA